jgi:pimeloyl-ACP methyl ester carboxylesterase
MKKIKGKLIKGSKDKPIVYDVFFKEDNSPKPIVFFSHGFKGFKDWGHFNYVAEQFANAGMVFVKYNFSHNGTTLENPLDFDDLEAFGNNNLLMELEELGMLMDHVLSDGFEFSGEIDTNQVGLLGHSRGGGISIVRAYEDDRVSKMVGWASVGEFDSRVPKQAGEKWKAAGVVHVPNARTNIDMPIYYQFYENYYSNYERLSIPNAIKNIDKPVLLIQGTEDEAVPMKEANKMKEQNDTIKLSVFEGAGHTFGIKHPFVLSDYDQYAKEVVAQSISFFK